MAHDAAAVQTMGAPVDSCRAAVIMVHGRGAAPSDILGLVPLIDRRDIAYVAPAAEGNTWYPYSFLSDISRNEPMLSSALGVLDRLVSGLSAHGVPRERIVLLGFSQGACLSGEFAVRHATRYGGVVMLSGGLIGPPGTRWDYSGDFERTPVFLGCSDVDPHVPRERVEESAAVFSRMGAEVTTRIYPGLGHIVTADEVRMTQALLDRLLEDQPERG